MEGLFAFFFWFMVLSPLLPFVVLASTGLTVALLHAIAAFWYEHV